MRSATLYGAALSLLLCAAPARAQGLLDAAAAAAAAGELSTGNAAASQNQANSVRRGFEEAAAREPRMPNVEGGGAGGAAGGAAGAAGAEAGDKGKRRGLILYDQLEGGTNLGTYSGDDEPAEAVPETYIVTKGDTLWSICQRFFNDPYYWPKLWAFNEMITNPHWIYPGDLISMYAPGKAPKRPVAAAPAPKPEEPARRGIQRRGPALPKGVYLTQNGFVEPGELDAAGQILGSKEEKIMLTEGDEVYVESSKRQPLKKDERYTVYRVLRPVTRPGSRSREVLGNIVEILATVDVKQVTASGVARAVLHNVTAPVERGFRVGPLRRTYKIVDPQVNRYNLEGQVIASMVPTSLVGVEQLIFVDLGKPTGLAAGNRLFVVRRGDGNMKTLSTEPVDDRRYPREVVAEILIMEVRDRTSAGLVTRQTKEVRMGDRVEARKDY